MMGIGFSEILVILLVAIIVINPKHVPEALFVLGKTVAKIKQQYAKIFTPSD